LDLLKKTKNMNIQIFFIFMTMRARNFGLGIQLLFSY